jgi:hypothetical protein
MLPRRRADRGRSTVSSPQFVNPQSEYRAKLPAGINPKQIIMTLMKYAAHFTWQAKNPMTETSVLNFGN